MTQADLSTSLDAPAGQRVTQHRLSRWWLMTPLLLILASIGVWQAWARFGQPPAEGDIRLYVVTRSNFPVVLEEKGELQAKKNVILRNEMESGTRAGATIIFIVPEGSQVKKGDLLVELAADTIEQAIRTQRIKVSTAESTLTAANNDLEIQQNLNAANINLAETTLQISDIEKDEWEEGLRVQQLQEAELALKSAEARKEQMAAQLDVSRLGLAAGIIFEVEFKGTEIEFDSADYTHRNATVQLEVLQTHTFKKERIRLEAAKEDAVAALIRAKATAGSEMQKAESAVSQAGQTLELEKAELKNLIKQVGKAKIYAPNPGLVVYHVERQRFGSAAPIDLGAQVSQNKGIIDLPDLSQMELVVQIHEADAERIRPGLPVKIEVAGVYEEIEGDSENGSRTSGTPKAFDGEIERIAQLADSRNRWMNPDLREFETKIRILGSDPRLKPGMTATAEIYIDHLEDVISVPVQAVYSRAGTSYTFVESAKGTEVREITLGSSSEKYVEVVDGLEVGEKVWLNISDEMLTLLPRESANQAASPEQNADARRRSDGASRRNRAGQGAGTAPGTRRGGQGRGGSGRGGA